MKRKPKFGEERGDWPALIAAGLVLLFFLLMPGAIFPETFVTPVLLPTEPDSIFVRYDKDGVTFSVDTINSSVPTDTAPSWNLNDDTLHTISFLIWYPGQDSAASYVFQRDLRLTSGTRYYPTPAFWGYATDSVRMQYWVNGTPQSPKLRSSGEQSYDTLYEMSDSSSWVINYRIYPEGASYGQNWVWATYWDTTGGASPESPAIGDFANVTGRIRFSDGGGVTGARVMAVRTGSGLAIDNTGGTSVMYARAIPPIWTDTAGSFTMTLMKTTAYSDSVFYDIYINYGAEEIAKIPRVTVLTNINLGDVVADR